MIAFLLIGVGIAFQAGWLTSGPAATPRKEGQSPRAPAAAPAPAKAEPRGDLLVRYGDGVTYAPKDLREAIQLAAVKDAIVILRNQKPLKLDVEKPISLAGDLRIKAAGAPHRRSL